MHDEREREREVEPKRLGGNAPPTPERLQRRWGLGARRSLLEAKARHPSLTLLILTLYPRRLTGEVFLCQTEAKTSTAVSFSSAESEVASTGDPREWALRDSNLRPSVCKTDALTN